MPRGGRRPGSGAPRGNTNALRRGGRSRRMRETWRAVQLLVEQGDEPRLRAISAMMNAAGLIGPDGKPRANIGKIVQLIHPMLVDSPSTTVNHQQSNTPGSAASQPAAPPAAESETPAPTAAQPADQRDREITTNNQTPEVP
jgi:hypothetical protein